MQVPTATPPPAEATLAELRAMLARLEGSGIARHDPAARQLLDSSWLLLGEPPGGSAAGPTRRRGGMRRLGQKCTRLALGLWWLLPFALAGWAAWAAFDGMAQRGVALCVAAALLGVAQRARAVGDLAYGVGFRMVWHAAIGRDWFAEAFSEAAEARLVAKQRAEGVMAVWRRWAVAQPEAPRLEHVPRCLATRFGPAAARAFRAALAATVGEGAGRPGAARRLARLRWSALMPLFERLAAIGALDAPDAAGAPPRAASGPTADGAPASAGSGDAPETVIESPELIARRQSLLAAIQQKRAEINTVHGWRMSKPAELAERDRHLGALRQELDALEAALLEIGGVAPKAGGARRGSRGGVGA